MKGPNLGRFSALTTKLVADWIRPKPEVVRLRMRCVQEEGARRRRAVAMVTKSVGPSWTGGVVQGAQIVFILERCLLSAPPPPSTSTPPLSLSLPV